MKKLKSYELIIVLALILLIVLVGPVGIIKNTAENSSEPLISSVTELISDNDDLKQFFIPQHKNLESIGVVINTSAENTDITDNSVMYIDVCTAQGELIKTSSVLLSGEDGTKNGYKNVELGIKLDPETLYYFKVYTDGSRCALDYRNNAAGPAENSMLLYDDNGIGDGANCLAVRYVYKVPLKVWQLMFYIAFILVLAVIVREEIREYEQRKEKRDN